MQKQKSSKNLVHFTLNHFRRIYCDRFYSHQFHHHNLIIIVSNKVIKNTSKYSIVSEFMYRNASIMHPPLKLAPSFERNIYIRTFLGWKNIKKLPYRIASIPPLLNLAEITFSQITFVAVFCYSSCWFWSQKYWSIVFFLCIFNNTKNIWIL